MDIRNGFDSLKSILGGNSAESAAAPAPAGAAHSSALTEGALGADSATLSSAAAEVSQTAGEDGARMDKVSNVQAALAAGTYSVPASVVATKVVDAMLAGNK